MSVFQIIGVILAAVGILWGTNRIQRRQLKLWKRVGRKIEEKKNLYLEPLKRIEALAQELARLYEHQDQITVNLSKAKAELSFDQSREAEIKVNQLNSALVDLHRDITKNVNALWGEAQIFETSDYNDLFVAIKASLNQFNSTSYIVITSLALQARLSLENTATLHADDEPH